jgi:hypothetical protein
VTRRHAYALNRASSPLGGNGTRAGWSPRTRAGYLAALLAGGFAMANLSWAAGSRVGLSTLGGSVQGLAEAGDRAFLLANLVAAAMKLGLAVLALLLVHPLGRRVPRTLLWTVGWIGAGALVLYGSLQLTGILLAGTGVVPPTNPIPAEVFWWRLLLWEPWFLGCGIALMVTLGRPARSPAKRPRDRETSS